MWFFRSPCLVATLSLAWIVCWRAARDVLLNFFRSCYHPCLVTTLFTSTENTVLDRKGVWALKPSARLVAVDVHVLHNLVRQLSKNLMEMVMIVFMSVVTLLGLELKFMGFCLGVRGGEVWGSVVNLDRITISATINEECGPSSLCEKKNLRI